MGMKGRKAAVRCSSYQGLLCLTVDFPKLASTEPIGRNELSGTDFNRCLLQLDVAYPNQSSRYKSTVTVPKGRLASWRQVVRMS